MPGTSPRVRDAVLGDAAAMAAVQARSWRVAYRGIAPDDFLDDLTDDTWHAQWTERLTTPPRDDVHHLVSVDEHDEPVAIALCAPASGPAEGVTGQLYVLYTDPAAWGRGHGSALLREVHQRLAADGHDRAQLLVAAGNHRSISFYEHHGWQRDGTTQRDEVNGVTFVEARMVRNLP